MSQDQKNTDFDTDDLGEVFGYESANPSLITKQTVFVVGGPRAVDGNKVANYNPPRETADGWEYGV